MDQEEGYPVNYKDAIPKSLGAIFRFLRISTPKGALAPEVGKKGIPTSVEMADVLNETVGRSSQGKQPETTLSDTVVLPRPASFSHTMVNDLENSKRFHLWKAARYANWSGLPVALILLIQELSAHLRDDEKKLAVTIAKATRNLCDHVIENVDSLANGNSDDKKSEEQKALLDNAFQAGFTAEDVELILIFDNLISSYDEEALNAKRKDSQERFRKM